MTRTGTHCPLLALPQTLRDGRVQRVGVRVPEHVAVARGAVVGEFGGRRQRRVRHLLDVGVGRGRLGRFLLAERLFEGAAQLQVKKKRRRARGG